MELKGRVSFSRVYLRHSRLLIREYESDDLKALRESTPGTFTHEEAAEFLEFNSDMKWQRPRPEFNLAVVHADTQQVIGGYELRIVSVHNKQAEIGFWIHPDFQRQGYATEATALMLEFAFQSLGMHRVSANCRPGNSGSIRTLQKCGLHQEGHFREHVWIGEKWEDSLVFGILENDLRETTQPSQVPL